MTHRINIRCCCDANRVLGTVAWPGAWPTLVENIKFRLRDGTTLKLPLAKAARTEWRCEWPAEWQPVRYEEIAVKSNNVPLERLRLIPGFREVDRVIRIGASPDE